MAVGVQWREEEVGKCSGDRWQDLAADLGRRRNHWIWQ